AARSLAHPLARSAHALRSAGRVRAWPDRERRQGQSLWHSADRGDPAFAGALSGGLVRQALAAPARAARAQSRRRALVAHAAPAAPPACAAARARRGRRGHVLLPAARPRAGARAARAVPVPLLGEPRRLGLRAA